MSDRDFAFSLLAMAQKDVNALHGMVNNKIFADEIFGFHAQQAVEKSLKAWIASLDVEFPLTHDISLLLSTLEDHRQSISAFGELVELTAFAVQFRYAAFEDSETLNRTDILAKVDMLFAHVQSILTT